MPLSPGARLGPYEILDAIGAGGMGEVYRARDHKLDRDVAIKVLPAALAGDAERIARFEREAKTLAALNHQHIAHTYGFEDSTGIPALVMELVEGPTLAERIAERPLPIDEALTIAQQIADALEAAHGQGIVHRDLKPTNIKVREDGCVKVLDFGLAKLTTSAARLRGEPGVASESPTITTPAMMTGVGTILGTAAYMSPEQARGKAVDKRADIWAFGCVLFEMLAGTRAFAGDDLADTLALVITKEPKWHALPPTIPAALRRLLSRCLQRDLMLRQRDIGDARLEIDELRSGGLEESAAIVGLPAASRWRRAVPWAAAAIAGAALLAVLLMRPRAPSPPIARVTLSMLQDNSLTIEGGMAISPDGRSVAFAARSPQRSGLYVRRLDEWEPHALPSTDDAAGPVFSPDGRWIAFSRNGTIEKVPVSGGPPQVVCKTGNSISAVSRGPFIGHWLPDETILYGTWPAALWRVSSDGGTPQLISRPSEGADAWYLWPEPLPGGRGMLLTIWQGGRVSVAVLAAGADKPRILVESGGRQHYLPTGDLVYVADGHLYAVAFDVERLQIRGGPTVVVDDVTENATASIYDVSVRGALVYQPAGSSLYRVVWKDRQGKATPVGTGLRRYESLALSADGRRFSATVYDGPARNVWTGRSANEPLTRLTFGNDDAFGLWSRDGTRLFYSVGQSNYNIFSTATDGSGDVVRLTQSSHAQNATSVASGGCRPTAGCSRSGATQAVSSSIRRPRP